MAPKQIKKFAVILDYSKNKFGVSFELSETERSGLDVNSALEAMAIADLLRNSQHATYDEETKTVETNHRPTGEAMKEWPNLNKPEPVVSTSSTNMMDSLMKRMEKNKQEQ
jgi:hypothetical protein